MVTAARVVLLAVLLSTHADARLGDLRVDPPAAPAAVVLEAPTAAPVAPATVAPAKALPPAPVGGTPPAAVIKPTGDYLGFVHEVVEACRARPLGRSAMSYFLFGLATPDFAKAGEWAEFGVGPGDMLKMISQVRYDLGGGKEVHGFDDFNGIPEDWNRGGYFGTVPAHEGNMNGMVPFNDTRVAFHVGPLNDTAKMFAADLQALPPPENATDPSENLRGQVTFAHFGTRLYSATAGVLEAMEDRLATGAFLVFDDMINYPNYEEGEMKALYESLVRTQRSVEVIGYEGPSLNESPQELERLSFNTQQPLPESVLFRLT